MSMFRFLKKKDGSKILQYKDIGSLTYKDVPMVEEETVMDKLYSALAEVEKFDRNRGKTFTILVSTKIMNEIKEYNHYKSNIHTLGSSSPNSFMHHRLYEVVDMKTDIKIVLEA